MSGRVRGVTCVKSIDLDRHVKPLRSGPAHGRVNDPLTTVATSQITTKYVYFVLNRRHFWYGLDYDYEYEYYEFAYQAHYYEDIFFDDGYDRYAASLSLNSQYGKNNYLTDYSYPEGCPNEDVGNGCTRLSKSD